MAGPRATVSTPVRKPRKGGIKSVIGEFVPAGRLAGAEAVQYLADGCGFPGLTAASCWVADEGNVGPKSFQGIESGVGSIFALYAGVECYLGPNTDYDERARALLDQGEDRAVEEWLWDRVHDSAAGGGAFASITLAVAELEEVADTGYIGLPVLLMSRSVAVRARAEKAILEGGEDGQLFTANGTPVLASGAFNDDVIIIIGWPTVYASDGVVSTSTYNLTSNLEMAIAERIYALAIDCDVKHKAGIPAPTPPAGDPVPDPLVLQIGTQPSSPIPDGTDVTVTVQANTAPDEVNLWYRINGGAWTDNGEMTEVSPLEFVENLDGTLANPGDVFDLYAKSGSTVSPTITINVT